MEKKLKKLKITNRGDVTPQDKKLSRHLAKAIARSFPGDRYPKLQVYSTGRKEFYEILIFPNGTDHLDENSLPDSLPDQSGAIH